MLAVTGSATTPLPPDRRAYAAADAIEFDGSQQRRDIALRAREREPAAVTPEPQLAVVAEPTGEELPLVGIVMGSESDMDTMAGAATELAERGIAHELRVMSAHRQPDSVAEYARTARRRGLRVLIAGAGLSAALPGGWPPTPTCR